MGKFRARAAAEREQDWAVGRELERKDAEIDRLKRELTAARALLADKDYIRLLADYNKGHLSHANSLAARELAALSSSPGDKA